ncbi:phage tail protein, partial [Enterococcus faecium]|nr:phage tail protein [Enterococcus faecium]
QRLANAKKYYGENSTEVQKLERELINQQTAQQRLSNDIDKTSKALAQSKGEFKTYESTMKDLDNEQQHLKSSASLVESEYKKWQATAGQSATESEKLAKAQEYVGKQSDIAEQKIEVLKKQLDATQKEFGETSTEALEMKTKLNDAEREFEELSNAAKNVDTSTVDDIGKKLDMGNLMEATDHLSVIGDKLIDVGSKSIEAAGKAQAMQAQFKQVFGSLEGEAQDAVEGMAEEFGMLPNTIKPVFTQYTSMFKGLGYDTKEAMELAGDSTQLAADAAAFYDKSMDDASESLNSFIKGNYEGGEQIGLFANDTQMAAYAVKHNLIPATEGAKKASEESLLAVEKAQSKYADAIKKHGEGSLEAREAALKLKDAQDKINEELGPQTQKWSDLDEATKQAVRVQYAEDMQKLAGATGQASRESDGLENQMTRAKQALEDFYASLGEDILPVFIKGLQAGAKALQGLAEWWSKLDGPMKNFILALGGILALLSTLAPVITAVVTIVGTFGSTVLLPIIGIIAGVAAVIAIVITAFQNWGAITDWFSDLWKKFTDWLGDTWESIKESASSVWDGVKETWSGFVDWVQEIWQGVSDWFGELWSGLVEGASNIWQGVQETWQAFVDWVSNIWNGVKEVWSIIWADIVGIVQIPWTLITSLIQAGINIIVGIFDVAGQLLGAAWQAVWTPISDFLKNTWDTMTQWISIAWNGIVTTFHTIFDPVVAWWNGIWTSISTTA